MYGGGLPMPDGLYPHGTRGYIHTGFDLNQVRCEYSTGLRQESLIVSAKLCSYKM